MLAAQEAHYLCPVKTFWDKPCDLSVLISFCHICNTHIRSASVFSCQESNQHWYWTFWDQTGLGQLWNLWNVPLSFPDVCWFRSAVWELELWCFHQEGHVCCGGREPVSTEARGPHFFDWCESSALKPSPRCSREKLPHSLNSHMAKTVGAILLNRDYTYWCWWVMMSIKTTVKGTSGDDSDSLFIPLLKESTVHLCGSKCQLSPGFSLRRNDRGALPRRNKSRQSFQMIFLFFKLFI